MKKPSWGRACAAHIGQVEVIIDSLGKLLLSIQKIIFAMKKLWLSIGGLSTFLFIAEKVDLQALSTLIN